jgi:hypothetical protein
MDAGGLRRDVEDGDSGGNYVSDEGFERLPAESDAECVALFRSYKAFVKFNPRIEI